MLRVQSQKQGPWYYPQKMREAIMVAKVSFKGSLMAGGQWQAALMGASSAGGVESSSSDLFLLEQHRCLFSSKAATKQVASSSSCNLPLLIAHITTTDAAQNIIFALVEEIFGPNTLCPLLWDCLLVIFHRIIGTIGKTSHVLEPSQAAKSEQRPF